MLSLFLALTLAQNPAASIKVEPSRTIDLDLTKLKGKLVRQLAWSPDGVELYLMTYDQNKDASIKKAYHFVIPLATGVPKDVDKAPEWAEKYWLWKSQRASPDDAALEIELLTEKKRISSVSLPMGGDLARGGPDSSAAGASGGLSTESAMAAANASQMADVRTMKLKGQVIGEWVNLPIVPGQTYGWAPTGQRLIAYAEQRSGKLVLMHLSGERQTVAGTKDVSHPAFSSDGSRLAYLEGRGKNRFALVVATLQK